MKFYLTPCYFLIVLQTAKFESLDCPDGWFGPNCTLKCRCVSKCLSDGKCSTGKCEPNYFGPSCQYADMVSQYHSHSVPSFLSDWDDESCNPFSNSTSVTVELTTKIQFSMYRMILKKTYSVTLNFSTTLNDVERCLQERKFQVGEQIIDVVCDNVVMLKTLRIDGEIASSVCTVYISSGRLVSLKQKTWQSSDAEGNISIVGSQNAVDDSESTCSLTHAENNTPEWEVEFSRPARLYFITVKTGDSDLHKTYYLILLDALRRNVAEIKLDTLQEKEIISIETTEPISILMVRVARSIISPTRTLKICNIVAFGDSVCPENMYGLDCERKCNCSQSEVCNFMTGTCGPGCPSGKYGFNCSTYCSRYCVTGTCNYYSGSCSPCVFRYVGDKCDRQLSCPENMFGPQCDQTCTCNVTEACNFLTGVCDPGCPVGYYKYKCSLPCSPYCARRYCNYYYGSCSPCRSGYFGNKCDQEHFCPENLYGRYCNTTCNCTVTEACNFMTGHCDPGCPVGFYEMNCVLRCSPGCAKGTCNYFYGSCSPCHVGYFGKKCDEECLPGTYGISLPCKNCSIGCNGTCNRVYGYCSNCNEYFMGLRCEECKPGSFGSRCQYKCAKGCKNASKCSNQDGYCECRNNYQGFFCADCRLGTYGSDCQFTCSPGCTKTCNNTDGRCICKPGFAGLDCKECVPGFFGANCRSQCSNGCNGKCSKKTGHCTCKKNYIGASCRECRKGTYGLKCEYNCSLGCRNVCNVTNGKCACRRNFRGSLCAECVGQRYGRRCDLTCSERCYNKICARMSGNCLGCTPGHLGEDCVDASKMSLVWVMPIPFMVIFIMIFITWMVIDNELNEESNREKTCNEETTDFTLQFSKEGISISTYSQEVKGSISTMI